MSRTISTTNLAEVNAAHLHEVVLVKMEFDTPAYAHSGIGTITYDGNDYTGVGTFGGVSAPKETDQLQPTALTLSLSGVDSALLVEALDSGNYGDVVTLYIGYRQDDGTLVDDPWLAWRGYFDHASVKQGAENIVSITIQHDLSVLGEKDGGRYTDEDQQLKFTGDRGFQFVTDQAGIRIKWGARVINGGGGPLPEPYVDAKESW